MPRKIRFTNIPVIKPRPDPLFAMKIDKLDPEFMTEVLLNLDPIDILNMCISYKSIRVVCDDELFWKRKTIQDFKDVSEEDEPPRGQTWKNFYFNKLNIHRELKQAIREGNYALVKELSVLITELEGEDTEGFFEDELHFSILENRTDITAYFLNNHKIKFTKDRGLQIICDQMKHVHSKVLTKRLLRLYRIQFPSIYPYYTKLMNCAIDAGYIDTVQDIYNIILSTTWRDPIPFVRYAKRKGFKYLATIIQKMYDDYMRWYETIKI